ncbi:tetratricopeptide repeat protein [Kitasatospora sp. NPDC101183]|uniref:tetratricopeptide repeat protein n=1 Tax=Kitasatospora sp. NPDC101183 TaxID=3364100 RepID=UPI00382F4F59
MATDASATSPHPGRIGSLVLPPTPPTALAFPPPPPAPFVGRSAVLDALLRDLAPRKAPTKPTRPTRDSVYAWRRDVLAWEATTTSTSLSGPPGSGRTALALRLAAEVVSRRWYSSVILLDLHDVPSPATPVLPSADAHAALLRALGVRPEDMPAPGADRLAHCRTVLTRLARRGLPVLLVIDGVSDHRTIGDLIPPHPRNAALVLRTTGKSRRTLLKLHEDNAVTLLGTPHVPLAQACLQRPLHLGIAAAQLALDPGLQPDTLLRRLESVPDVTHYAYGRLDPAHARLFRLASLHPGPYLRTGEAAALFGLPLLDTLAALDALTNARLLSTSRGRYAYHPHLRRLAQHRTLAEDADPHRREAVRRLLGHYTDTAARAVPALRRQESRALAWFDAERHTLAAAVRLAVDSAFHAEAAALSLQVATLLDVDSRTRSSDLHASHLVAAECADLIGDFATAGRLWHRLGRNRRHARDADGAFDHFVRAATAHHTAGDAGSAAAAFADLLGLLPDSASGVQLGRYVDRHRRVAALLRDLGEPAALAVLLSRLGNAHLDHGDHPLAEECHLDALRLREDLGDGPGTARSLVHLGNLALRRVEPDQALPYYQRAHDLFESGGKAFSRARCLANLGLAEAAAGRGRRARKRWEAAVALFISLGKNSDASTFTFAIKARGKGGLPQPYVFPESLKAAAEALSEARPAPTPRTEVPDETRPFTPEFDLDDFAPVDWGHIGAVPDHGLDYFDGTESFDLESDIDPDPDPDPDDDGPDYDWDD